MNAALKGVQRQTGTIDKHRLQHFTSYVPDQQKLANIIGAVTRHSGYQMPTFRPFQSAISTLQFISVLVAESNPTVCNSSAKPSNLSQSPDDSHRRCYDS